MATSDAFGDRMKGYEDSSRFEPCLPIIVRIDGKSFHTYTRNFDRPYDKWMSGAMQATTKFLVEQTCARIGFTQSDEITLILYSDDPKSQVFFDGKIYKIISVTAAMASVQFNQEMERASLPKRGDGNLNDGKVQKIVSVSDAAVTLPHFGRAAIRNESGLPPAYFDSRAYTVPDKGEASNVLLWRELDAVRNSVSMMAHHYFGHSALKKKSVPEMKDMLASIGEPWEDAPASFTHGTHYVRREVERPFTDDDLARIPEQFHPPVGTSVKRNVVERVDEMPKGIGERVALIFGETSEGNWLKQEFRRASERSAQVPPFAKPVWIKS